MFRFVLLIFKKRVLLMTVAIALISAGTSLTVTGCTTTTAQRRQAAKQAACLLVCHSKESTIQKLSCKVGCLTNSADKLNQAPPPKRRDE